MQIVGCGNLGLFRNLWLLKSFGDAKLSDAFISSPDDTLTITPLGKYRVSLYFKTKNSIKISYNWEIYTLEKFQSVMNDWTEEEIKIAKQ